MPKVLLIDPAIASAAPRFRQALPRSVAVEAVSGSADADVLANARGRGRWRRCAPPIRPASTRVPAAQP